MRLAEISNGLCEAFFFLGNEEKEDQETKETEAVEAVNQNWQKPERKSQKAFMKPVSPVIPGVLMDEVVYAADQPEYQPLPAFKCVNGKILTRWELTEAEKRLVTEQGYIYLAVNTFNQPLQPVYLSATPPDSIDYVDWEDVPEGVTASRIEPPTSENRETAGDRSLC